MHDPLATSAVAADSLDRLPSPPSGSHLAESPSGDMGASAAMIAILLLCGLICGLSLNVAIRCFLRGPDNTASSSTTPRKPPVVSPRGPFAWETSLARGEAEDVCAVCLTEFVEGESIRVLGKCKHGFHAECIEKWLRSHSSSCPTCRTSCLLEDESSSSTSSQVLEIDGNVDVNEQCDENNGGQSIDDGRPQQSRIESV